MKRNLVIKPKSKGSGRQALKSNRRRYLVALIAFILFLVVGFSMFNIVSLKMQEAQALELKQKLLLEKAKLQTELSLVFSPAYIEQQARIKLKMIKPGETLYILPEEKATDASIEEKTE